METEYDTAMATRLRRLESGTAVAAPPFDYEGLLARHASRTARAQRRHRVTRATAGALVVALVVASVWRLEPTDVRPMIPAAASNAAQDPESAPRIVRADTYLALAALEDHIARLDDAISVARVYAPQGAEVARLERTRSELLDSYAQVRYAELVSANF
jgi:hypothetical protein